MPQDLLYYDLGPGVEAFTTRRDSVLPYPVIQGHQVHGTRVAIIDRPWMTREELEGYDAFITNLPGVAIGVRTADCVPVLLHDPVRRAVAAIHAGWKGTVLHIVQAAVDALRQEYGCSPSDLKAVIGPSIGPDSFRWAKRWRQSSRMRAFPWMRYGLSAARETAPPCPEGIM